MEQQGIQIKNLTIGAGIPKICVPVTGHTEEEIFGQTRAAAAAKPDLVEWRADWYEKIMEPGSAEKILSGMSGTLGGIPILFTFRTAAEGGNRKITPEDYDALNCRVARQGAADLVDVEGCMSGLAAKELIRKLHDEKRVVVASSHHFHETPSNQKMTELFRELAALDADILKLAVMPEKRSDVLRLLEVTQQMREEIRRPVISMAMGSLGTISRVCGETFGSCVTFASAGRSSAPGQLDIGDVRTIQEILHRAV